MLRLSVTDLETLRYHKAIEGRTTEELLRSLAHVEPPNRKMEAGKALASFFEKTSEGEYDSTTVDGWRIDFNLNICTGQSFLIPPMREMKLEVPILTPSGPVTLVGKVDGFHGLVVHDQKLTEKLDIEERYTDSLQWRSYLWMLGASKFVYDVFVGKVEETENVVTITEYHPVTFWTYPDIERDVLRAVYELASVVDRYKDQIEALRKEAAP